ncbi:MAG: HK97-gp10 family putative phage morphogenesis protein [Pseudomonadota bacterium]
MKTKITVDGFRDVERALAGLEKEVSRRSVARSALKKGGAVFASTARRLSPIDDGALRRSIGVGTKLDKAARAGHVRKDPVEVFAGAGPVPQAVQQEFGNENHPAQPFMRPAWDSQKDWALAAIQNELEDATDRAIKRQVKRNAKKKARR